MLDYIVKILADLPDEIDGETPSPAANHLFAVDDNRIKVDEKKAQFFDTYGAKTLFLCKGARPDLQTAVACLCTRFHSFDEDGYKKLTRMLQFLRATKDYFLTLSADRLHNARWWVDASYALHPDMKSRKVTQVVICHLAEVSSTGPRNDRNSTRRALRNQSYSMLMM
jgi:hypothetical protein